jgi:hypothetical protein
MDTTRLKDFFTGLQGRIVAELRPSMASLSSPTPGIARKAGAAFRG